MRPRPWRTIVISIQAGVLCAICSSVQPAEPGARARVFATLPDWTGIWENEGAAAVLARKPLALPKLMGKPPYTAQAEKLYAPANLALRPGDDVLNALARAAPALKVCASTGFPGVMEAPVPDVLFELIVTPERVLLTVTDGTVREIYTDGRAHPKPADLWPTPLGDSIGHWEGTTLVVDTIAREPGPVSPFPGAANLSDQARFTERLTRTGADALEDVLTIEDPQRFAQPWRLRLRYVRVHDVDRLIPIGCEHDRDTVVEGKIVVTPP
jgi:hypothetical protein